MQLGERVGKKHKPSQFPISPLASFQELNHALMPPQHHMPGKVGPLGRHAADCIANGVRFSKEKRFKIYFKKFVTTAASSP